MTRLQHSAEVRGRYLLGAVIGEGGMAKVRLGMLVSANGFRRIVATKEVRPEPAGTEEATLAAAKRRLLVEARLASRMRHVNIVSVLDVVEAGGEIMIVMEYVDGVSLASLLWGEGPRGAASDNRLPLDVIVAIVVGALHGLHAAHESRGENGAPLQLLHRDVTPENILIDREGGVRIADFGIARAIGARHETKTGMVAGKLGYLAPEVLRGDAADRRADIYSAGVVLWEALAGRRLFAAKNPAKLWMDVANAKAPKAIRTERADVPKELDALLSRVLAREPNARPSTAAEVAAALERCVVPATASAVASLVRARAHDELEQRAAAARALESCEELPPDVLPTRVAMPHAIASAAPVAPVLPSSPLALPLPAAQAASPPSSPSSRAKLPVVALAAVAIMSVAAPIVLATWSPSRPPADVVVPPAASELLSPAPPASPAAPAAGPTATTASSVGAVAAPLDTASTRPVRRPTPTRAPLAPTPPTPRSCDPAYDLDVDGHKVYRTECIQGPRERQMQ